jgi:hypothetical protein
MEIPTVKSFLTLLRHKPALGLPGIAALLLLGVSSVFYASVLRPAEERLRALEEAIAKRKPAPALLSVGHQSAPADPAAKLGAFYAFFDKGNTFTDWLARLYAVADRAGVELRQGDYRRVAPAEVPLVLEEVTLPVTGEYVKIRAFAEGVLSTVPVSSLDHVSLRRQRTNLSLIEAELKFTFYLPQRTP